MICLPCEKSTIDCCANCETINGRLLTCGKCELVKYCSKECQIQHWKSNHKLQCIPLEKRSPKTQEIIKEETEEYDICCICMESVKYKDKSKSRYIVCSHSFHSECIYKWLEIKQCCPLCNKIFSENNKLSVEFIRVMRNGNIIEINALINKLLLCEQSNDILFMLSELYICKGQDSKAEQILKISIKKFPSNIFIQFNLAKFYSRTNQRYLARK